MAYKWVKEGTILKELLKEKEVTRPQVAQAVGVSVDVVDNWCIGRTRMNPDHRKTVAGLLDVTPGYLKELLTGEARIGLSSPGRVATPRGNLKGEIRVERTGYRMVPIYGSITAGQMAFNSSDIIDWVEMQEWGGDFERWGRRVEGDSMELPDDEGFSDGDYVIFEDRRHEDGSAVHAVADGEDAFKIYRRTPQGEMLFPLNRNAHEPLPLREYTIKGVAVARLRPNRFYTDERKYKGGYKERTLAKP